MGRPGAPVPDRRWRLHGAADPRTRAADVGPGDPTRGRRQDSGSGRAVRDVIDWHRVARGRQNPVEVRGGAHPVREQLPHSRQRRGRHAVSDRPLYPTLRPVGDHLGAVRSRRHRCPDRRDLHPAHRQQGRVTQLLGDLAHQRSPAAAPAVLAGRDAGLAGGQRDPRVRLDALATGPAPRRLLRVRRSHQRRTSQDLLQALPGLHRRRPCRGRVGTVLLGVTRRRYRHGRRGT